jgi:sugar lactone lactonase YvrE
MTRVALRRRELTDRKEAMSPTRILAFVIAGACAVLCANPTVAERLRDEYVVDSNSGLEATPIRVPEGVAFDPVRAEFYATSVFGGRISAIDGQSGIERTFYKETDPTLAFVGVKVAPALRVVWVCSIDITSVSAAPTSWVYALKIDRDGNGRLIRRIDLPVPFFCNDLALDSRGNVYVTDSAGDAVMRIRPQALQDQGERAQVFAKDSLLAKGSTGPGIPAGMNGIAVTPDDRYLLVAHDMPSRLLRIALDAPSQVSIVSLSGDALGQLPSGAFGPDGIIFVRGRLYVVLAAGVQELTFTDRRYAAATVRTDSHLPFGLSTAADSYQSLYVIDSEIHVLLNDPSLPIELPHHIVRVPLEAFGRSADLESL